MNAIVLHNMNHALMHCNKLVNIGLLQCIILFHTNTTKLV